MVCVVVSEARRQKQLESSEAESVSLEYVFDLRASHGPGGEGLHVLSTASRSRGYFLVIAVCVYILLLCQNEWRTSPQHKASDPRHFLTITSFVSPSSESKRDLPFFDAIPGCLSDCALSHCLSSSNWTLKYTLQHCLGFVIPQSQLDTRRVSPQRLINTSLWLDSALSCRLRFRITGEQEKQEKTRKLDKLAVNYV